MIRPSFYPDSVDIAIQKARQQLAWMEFLRRHLEPIQGLENLIVLNTLWDEPGPREDILPLLYIGKARSEESARADLAAIMQGFRTIFGDLQIIQRWDKPPDAYYKGTVTWDNRVITLELKVPWLPANCVVHVRNETSYTRGPGRKSYSVSCKR